MFKLSDKCGIPIDLGAVAVPDEVRRTDIRRCLNSPDVISVESPQGKDRKFCYYMRDPAFRISVSYKPDLTEGIKASSTSIECSDAPASGGRLVWFKEELLTRNSIEMVRQMVRLQRVVRGHCDDATPVPSRRMTERRTQRKGARWQVSTRYGAVWVSEKTWRQLGVTNPTLRDDEVRRVLEHPQYSATWEGEGNDKKDGRILFGRDFHNDEEMDILVDIDSHEVIDICIVPVCGSLLGIAVVDRRGLEVTIERRRWRFKLVKHPELALAYPRWTDALTKPAAIERAEKNKSYIRFRLLLHSEFTVLLGRPEDVGWMNFIIDYHVDRNKVSANFVSAYLAVRARQGDARWILQE